MSVASNYEDKARNLASGMEGNTYATLLLAYHQHTANLIAYQRSGSLTNKEAADLQALITYRVGLKDL